MQVYFCLYTTKIGHATEQSVMVLRYESEGREFDTDAIKIFH